MRKTYNIQKSLQKAIQSKVQVNPYEITDKFTLNSLLKDMKLEPLTNYHLNKKKVVTYENQDEFNKELLMQKNIELKNTVAKADTMRIGLVAEKVGMTSYFDRFGAQVPLTILKVENNQVTHITKLDHIPGRYLVEVGAGYNPKLPLPVKGHLYKNNIPPKRHLASFRVSEDALLPIGYAISLRHFMVGQLVDIQAVSKGKGTQGVMARWGFKGGVKTHGNSLSHRAPGSIGNREFPARVWPGKKMSGKTGNEWITEKARLIYKTDYENSLIYVHGGVPGNAGGKVLIRDSWIKRHIFHKYVLNPTFIPEPGKKYENVTIFFENEDKFEKYPHENDERMGVSEEEEEGPQGDEQDEMELGTGVQTY